MASFGWSVGDIVSAVKITIKVVSAFKSTSGAVEKYQQSVDFLKSFESTLTQLRRYIQSNPNDKYASDLSERLQSISKPWKRFEEFVKKYEDTLGKKSKKSRLGKAPQIVVYTLKDLDGEVQRLKEAVSTPFQLIIGSLSLQQLDHWSNSPVSLKISHIEQMLTAFHSIKASAQDLAEGQDEGKQSRRSHSEKLEHVRTLLDSTKTALLQALKAQERKSERGVEILVTKSSSITKTLEQQQIALEELQVIVEENQKSLKEISRAESAATDDPNRKSSPAVAIPSTLSLAYAILVPLITGLTTAAATIPFSAKPSIPRSDRIPQAAPATESPNGLNTPRSKLPVIVTYGDDQLRDKQSSIRQAPKPVREDPASICDRQLQKSPSHARKNCPQLQGKSKDSCNGGSEWFLECPFWFLDCMFATLDQEKWMAHSFIHFGPISPPKRTQCPVQNCEEKFHSTNEDRPRVWTLRMHHVAQHYQTAKDTPKWKPDYKLSKYLWRKRLISTEIYDELRCNWNGEFAPSAYLQSSGLAEERRARGMWLDAVRRRVEEARCVRNSTIGGACRIDQCIIIDGKENLDDNSTIRGENDEGDEDSRDSDSDDDTCVGSNDGDSELTEPNKKQGDPSNQDKKPDKDADFGKDVGKGFRPRPLLPSKLEYEKTGRISEDIVKYERYTLVEAKVMAYLRQDMIDFKDATSPQNWMRTYYV